MMTRRRHSLPTSRRKLIALMGRALMVALMGGAAACALLLPRTASAQPSPPPATSFPTKTLRIIVPFTPGGANDVVAREIAAGLQASLKETAVVENRPGGGGTIAYAYVAKSPPDGHLLLIAPASFTMG